MKKGALMTEMFKWGVLSAVIAVALPDAALAQNTVYDLVERVQHNELPIFPQILNAVCYVGGGFMMVSGSLALKKHAENPASTPMGQGIARLLTGGALVSVPAVIRVLQNTLFDNTSGATFSEWSPM